MAIDRKGTIVSTYVDGRGVAKATRQAKTQVKPTGVFGAFRLPDYHGSDDVRVANEDLARRAKQEMRTWRQDSRRKATAARYRRQRKAAQRAAADGATTVEVYLYLAIVTPLVFSLWLIVWMARR